MDKPEDELIRWTDLRPRKISDADRRRFEGWLREIFTAIGMPADTPGTRRTPERFLKAMIDATDGYEGDENLITSFPSECPGGPDCKVSQVIEGPVPFYSLCEHHALPFFGHAYLGYIAHDHILGISKLTRLVRLFARRFSVQERMGQQLADLLYRLLKPHGVAVYLGATHLCTQMRGVREHESRTWTTHFRGNYLSDAALRAEFLRLAARPSRE